MIVTPVPISSLIIAIQLAIIPTRIVVGFNRPTVVKDALVGIPHMIVGVIRIVGPITHSDCTPTKRQRR
jgi:hypothetical protein